MARATSLMLTLLLAGCFAAQESFDHEEVAPRGDLDAPEVGDDDSGRDDEASCGAPTDRDGWVVPIGEHWVAVDETLVVDLQVSPASEGVEWNVLASSIPDLDRHAEVGRHGASSTLTWTPNASHLGVHRFEVTATDGDDTDTECVIVTVEGSSAPMFVGPPGGTFDLGDEACIDVLLEVVDGDSTSVEIRERGPLIQGGELLAVGELSACWFWCPSPAQIVESRRHVLHLEADDGSNPPTPFDFEIVLVVP